MFKRGVVGVMVLLGLWLADRAGAQNVEFSYEGRVRSGGVPFDGNGHFKFAVVSTDGTVCYWSNDGVTLSGNEPTSSVPIAVSGGFFSVIIGDEGLSNMAPLDAAIFNTDERVRLRVWFSDGANGFQQLSPDRPITNPALIGLQTKHELTIYVNPLTGNDRFAGNKPNKPKKTIQGAWDALPKLVNTTATIQLAHGEYYEAVTMQGKIVAGDTRIVLRGDPVSSGSTRIMGSADRATSTTPVVTPGREDGINLFDQRNIRIEWLTFDYHRGTAFDIRRNSFVEIDHCRLLNSYAGIFALDQCTINLSNSLISDSLTGPRLQWGVYAGNSVTVLITDTQFLHHQSGAGTGVSAVTHSRIELARCTLDGFTDIGAFSNELSSVAFEGTGNLIRNSDVGSKASASSILRYPNPSEGHVTYENCGTNVVIN
jgi:hypothetical protein